MAVDTIRLKSPELYLKFVWSRINITSSIRKALSRRPQLIPLLNAKEILTLDSPKDLWVDLIHMTSYYLSLIIVNEMTSRMLSISIQNVFMTSFEVRDLVAKSNKDIDYI